MGVSDRTDSLAAVTTVASEASAGSVAGRQRLAEALRANLGRRKAQKRDRSRKGKADLAADETPRPGATLNERGQRTAVKGGTVTRTATTKED